MTDPPPSVRRTHRDWQATLNDIELRADEYDIILNPTPADWATTHGHGYNPLHITYNITDLLAELADLYSEDGAL